MCDDNAETFARGARLVISRNLALRAGQQVVIITDGATFKEAHSLAEAAHALDVLPTMIYVSRAQQQSYDDQSKLPFATVRALESAHALITAVNDSGSCTGFRTSVLGAARGQHSKIAHMPGLTSAMLCSLVETDYAVLEAGCEAFRLPLLLGNQVTVMTSNHRGETHTLELQLGRWDFAPTVSSGIVRSNSFDNVPSGETYVAPIKGTAHGTLVINGSVTGYVFGKDDEITLRFDHGKLVDIDPLDHEAAKFLWTQIENSRRSGDQEPDYLCELGFGTNTAVKHLTGQTLLDEKAIHTAHVALGDNSHFGGDVRASRIHEDLIFRKPTVLVDGDPILDRGHTVSRQERWSPSSDDVDLATSPYGVEDLSVQWTDDCQVEFGATGTLRRQYVDGAGNSNYVTVGDEETARLAAQLYDLLSNGHLLSAQSLAQQLGRDEAQVRSVLHIMGETYDLVQIVSEASY